MTDESRDERSFVDAEVERMRSFEEALDAATPRIYLSTVLVAVNVAVYVLMVARGVRAVNPTTDELIRWGANYGPLTQSGEWWRLFTSAFIHVGILHLLMNMAVLWTGGHLIERLFGQASFAAVYAISALGGSLTSIAIHPMTTSAGASGAIFGIYGGMIAYLVVCQATLPNGIRSAMIQSALTFVAYNLLYGLALPHVDVAAHVGGLVAGFLAGAAMATPMATPAVVRVQRAAIVTVAATALLAGGATRLQRFDDWSGAINSWLKDEDKFDRRVAEEAAKVDARKIPPKEFADRIDKEFIPELEQQRARMAALRLPEAERTKANGLVAFLGLKIDALKLMSEAERTGNAETLERANKKNEEALAAMLAVAPSPALTARIQRLSQSRELRQNYADQLKRLQQFDRSVNVTYEDAVKRLRANQSTPAEFASTIEQNVLKPWNDERERLAKLTIPPEQKDPRQRILDYMALRGEAWQLIADGVRSKDARKIQLAATKTAAAVKLFQQQQKQ